MITNNMRLTLKNIESIEYYQKKDNNMIINRFNEANEYTLLERVKIL
jgi:hypothetical protein